MGVGMRVCVCDTTGPEGVESQHRVRYVHVKDLHDETEEWLREK